MIDTICITQFIGNTSEIIHCLENLSFDKLAKLFNHWDENIRYEVIRTLRQCHFLEAKGIFIKAIKDESYPVCKEATSALQEMRFEQIEELVLDSLINSKESNKKAIIEYLIENYKENYHDLLINYLDHPDSSIKIMIIDFLSSIRDDKVLDVIISATRDNDQNVRIMAINALGNYNGNVANKALILQLQDDEIWVKCNVINSLCRINNNNVSENILPFLRSYSEDIREAAVKALGNIGDRCAVLPLIGILLSYDVELIAITHNSLNDEELIAITDNSLNDEELIVITQNSLIKIIDRIGIKQIIGLVKNESNAIVIALLGLIKKFPKYSYIDFPLSLLMHKNEKVKISAIRALGALKLTTATYPLLECLKDQNDEVLVSVTNALGEIAHPWSYDALIELLHNSNFSVSRAAALALGKLGNKKCVSELVNILQNYNVSIDTIPTTLGMLKDSDTLDVLIKALKHPDIEVCKQAVLAIAEFKVKIALDALHNVLLGARQELKSTAIEAIGKYDFEIADDILLEFLLSHKREKDILLFKRAVTAIKGHNSHKVINCLHDLVNGSFFSGDDAILCALQKLDDKSEFYQVLSFLYSRSEILNQEKLCSRILSSKSESIVVSLISLLDEKDYQISDLALEILCIIDSEKKIEPFHRMLRDKFLKKRILIIRSLERIEREKSMEILNEIFDGLSVEVCYAACDVAHQSKSVSTIDFLFKMTKHNDYGVRERQRSIYNRYFEQNQIDQLHTYFISIKEDERNFAICVLGNCLNQDVYNILIEALNDPFLTNRKNAAYYLKRFKNSEVVASLLSVIEENDYAPISLSVISDKNITEQLINSAKMGTKFAIEAMGLISDHTAFDELIHILKTEKNNENKLSVIESLCLINDPRAVSIILEVLNNENSLIIPETETILIRLANNSIIEEVIPFLDSDNVKFKCLVIKIISRFSNPKVHNALIGILHDSNQEIINAAVIALASMADNRSIDSLISVYDYLTPYIKEKVIYSLLESDKKIILPIVKIAANDSSSNVRIAAAQVLSKIGGDCAKEALKKMIFDSDYIVRKRAVQALSRLGDHQWLLAGYGSTN